MKRLRFIRALLMLLVAGCSGMRYVPKGEQLYTGKKVTVVSSTKVTDGKKAKKEIEELIQPKANRSFLGSRPFLWVWYVTGETREKGFRHWIKTKIGEPPVYMSMVDAPLVSEAIDAKLYNMGFFDSHNRYEIKESKNGRKVSVSYLLDLREPYTIDTVLYPSEQGDLEKQLKASTKNTLLKKGTRYDLDLLLEERGRIEDRLKRHGFYYFRGENILYQMDTAIGKRKVNLYLTMKPESSPKSKLLYRIAEVNVFPDYRPGRDSASMLNPHHKLVKDSVNYFNESGYIRPDPVIRSVFLKNGAIYDRRRHNLTNNRLNDLGVFKLVNVHISEKDSSPGAWLAVNIYLAPLPKRSLSVEMQGVSKSNNFIGPALTVSLRNRNRFKGAELIVYNLRGSFETQFNGLYKGLYTYELNPRIELYVPRFMAPVRIRTNSFYVPHTKYIADYSYLSRAGYFSLNSFKFSFGYKWKQSVAVDHDLGVANVNYFHIMNTSEDFNELIRRNIVLRRRFEQQFIAGSSYSFFYNEQPLRRRKRNPFYFNGNAELAGNSLALLSGGSPNATAPSQVLGINFAQFARLDVDVRKYFNLADKKMFAMRFIAGIGIPYGNSSSMPYIRQFFSGGAYSVRGFRAYSLGPGSYVPPDSLKNIFFLQQGGEIKLEGNVEYRFPLAGVVRGALFADAGNVWLNKPNPEIPGGEFDSGRLFEQIAVALGTGVRVDLDFFVIRLDLGLPVKKPSGNNRAASTSFSASDMIYNLAFGYPF